MGKIVNFSVNRRDKELEKQQATIAKVQLDNTVPYNMDDFVILGITQDGADIEIMKSNTLKMVQYAGQVISKITTTMDDMDRWEREAISSELQCMISEVKNALNKHRSW